MKPKTPMQVVKIPCSAVLEAFQDALDERLAAEKRPLWLNAHLVDCAACKRRARELEALDRLAQEAFAEAHGVEALALGRVLHALPAAAALVIACGLTLHGIGVGLAEEAARARAVAMAEDAAEAAREAERAARLARQTLSVDMEKLLEGLEAARKALAERTA